MLLSANDGCHNARPIDRKFVFFAYLATHHRQELTGRLGCLAILTFRVAIIPFGIFKYEAKDDHTLRVTNTSHFLLACLQILRRVYHLPDVMFTLTAVVSVALQTGIS